MRKLPIYFLIDNSESMVSGDGAKAIKNGLNSLINGLRGEPMALETSYLSLITYSEFAIQHSQLTDLSQFKIPSLAPLGRNKSFGAALGLLSYSIGNEVAQPTRNEKGDWRPLVIIITDGAPTDDWQDALADLQMRKIRVKILIFIANPNFDFSVYQKVTSKIFRLNATSANDLRGLFNWETIFPYEDGSLVTNGTTSANVESPPPPSSIDTAPEIKNTSLEIQNSYKPRIKRLPIYILADVSSKDNLDLINNGIHLIVKALRGEPQALETAWLSVISFDSDAKQLMPLTDLISFREPQLKVGRTATAADQAFLLLSEKLGSEVKKGTLKEKGDWNPYVFILINGDSIQYKNNIIKNNFNKVKLIFCICGARESNIFILKNLFSEKTQCPDIHKLELMTEYDFSVYFQWHS